jgi:O-acetyl-ADP-ribose deacetylase
MNFCSRMKKNTFIKALIFTTVIFSSSLINGGSLERLTKIEVAQLSAGAAILFGVAENDSDTCRNVCSVGRILNACFSVWSHNDLNNNSYHHVYYTAPWLVYDCVSVARSILNNKMGKIENKNSKKLILKKMMIIGETVCAFLQAFSGHEKNIEQRQLFNGLRSLSRIIGKNVEFKEFSMKTNAMLILLGINILLSVRDIYSYAKVLPDRTYSPFIKEINIKGRKVTLTLVQGDIVKQKFENQNNSAIVNAANPSLEDGGGIAGAVFRAAGNNNLSEHIKSTFPINQKLSNSDEYKKFYATWANNVRVPIGEAVTTPGFGLSGGQQIIHTVGPVGNHPDREMLLRNCYQRSLNQADINKITKIAIPPISTGIYGYNLQDAIPVALRAIIDYLTNTPNSNIQEIRLVADKGHVYNTYKKELEKRL